MPMKLPVLTAPAADGGFQATLDSHGLAPLTRAVTTTLQINVGRVCNQACTHCHVEAGPKRTESMTEATARRAMHLLHRTPSIEIVDITGGAPELNANFRWLVKTATDAGRAVIDRCNLTVLLEDGQEDTPEFLASNAVHVIASLPCYSRDNVDDQRGKGVFEKSVRGLERLNQLGYGRSDGELRLDLVYNPSGTALPPPQSSLEGELQARAEARARPRLRFAADHHQPAGGSVRSHAAAHRRARSVREAPGRQLQPSHRVQPHVSDSGLGGLGRAAVRLRLQSDAGAGPGRPALADHDLRPRRLSPALRKTTRRWPALLRLHGGIWIELRGRPRPVARPDVLLALQRSVTDVLQSRTRWLPSAADC